MRYCSTSTKSLVPSEGCVPGVAKVCGPVLGNGDPLIGVDVPVVGSYHDAFMDFENIAMLRESVVATGVYTMACAASEGVTLSGTQAAVAYVELHRFSLPALAVPKPAVTIWWPVSGTSFHHWS